MRKIMISLILAISTVYTHLPDVKVKAQEIGMDRTNMVSDLLLEYLRDIFSNNPDAKVYDKYYNEVTGTFIEENLHYFYTKQYSFIKDDIMLNEYLLTRSDEHQNSLSLDTLSPQAVNQNTTKTVYVYRVVTFPKAGTAKGSMEFQDKFIMSIIWNMNTGVAVSNNSSVSIPLNLCDFDPGCTPYFETRGKDFSIYQTYKIKTSHSYTVYITFAHDGVNLYTKKECGRFYDYVIMDSDGKFTITKS